MEDPIQLDDLGVSLFSETSKYLWDTLEVQGTQPVGKNFRVGSSSELPKPLF